MKLPSLAYLSNNAKIAFLRFPLSLISAFLVVLLGIHLVDIGSSIDKVLPEFNLLLCAGLGISLYFCAKVIADKKAYATKGKILLNVLATMLLVLIYFFLPGEETTHNTAQPYIQFAIYTITCHLFVSFVPFLFSKQLIGFWHYNKILFLRFLGAILYSGFIYIGLVLALAALHLLFDVKIPDKLYFKLWITVACFFNTWFFLGGIPKDFAELETRVDYPKALRIFSQYVLLPLLTLYLIILYAYGAKILISGDWPKGVVSYLIICVSVLGILSFLLLHPYGEQNETVWIKKASKGYYFLLFPLLFILFTAIFMRLNDYGITINRYLILLLGIWLTLVCVYTSIGKTNIKFIPASLATLLVLISFGPWGLFSMSERSQINRLQFILEQAGILKNRELQNENFWVKDSAGIWISKRKNINQGRLNDSLHNEVHSIVEYLDDFHGFSGIQHWYSQNIDSIVQIRDASKKTRYSNLEADMYMGSLGLSHQKIYNHTNNSSVSYYAAGSNDVSKVSGYDYYLTFDRYLGLKETMNIARYEVDSLDFELTYVVEPQLALVFVSQSDTLEFDLSSFNKQISMEFGLEERDQVPQDKMSLTNSNTRYEVKLQVQNIGFETKAPYHLANLSGYLLVKRLNSAPSFIVLPH